MERPYKLLGLWIITLLLLANSYAAQTTIEKWSIREYWGQLTPKMTERVVVDLLGEPQEKEVTTSSQIWYYAETPERDQERIVSRPLHGFLRFRTNQSDCILYNWREPDWTKITPRTEIQYIAEQRQIEQELRAEESRKKALEQQQTLKANAEQAQALRQQQFELQRQQSEQQRLKMSQIRQQQATTTPPSEEKKGFDLSSPTTAGRYFIYSSIAFISIALLICVVRGVKFFMWSR